MIASWNGKKSWSSDFQMKGDIKFEPLMNGSVEVTFNLKGVPPGKHGIHIHEKGMFCEEQLQTTNPCNCTHGHYNPEEKDHGFHVGDLCFNIEPDTSGNVKFSYIDGRLGQYLYDLPGRTVVLHEDEDDLGLLGENRDPESLKSGNAGNRIACAEIFQEKKTI